MDEIMNSRSQSQEVFERVWARVMGSAAPRETAAAAPASEPQPEPVSQPAPQAQPVMAPQRPAPPPQRPQPAPPQPQPKPQPKPCCLRQQVMDSLEQWHLARLLLRRAGKQSRQVSNLAAQLHQQAKQLSAAYFLQSGVRYWPVAQLTPPRMTTYVGGLRQLYQRGQALTEEFQKCRTKGGSPDLVELYGQLAQEGVKRAAVLRRLLEQTGM